MQSIDSTALSTALPTLARAFRTDPVDLKLCLTAYIMALAVFVPASAWMADRYGARRVFMGAMMVFLLGSVLCALSHSLLQLVGALGVAAVLRFVPRIRQPHPGRFDTPGYALAATAISAAMIAAETMGVDLFPAWVEYGAWVLAAGAGFAYI